MAQVPVTQPACTHPSDAAPSARIAELERALQFCRASFDAIVDRSADGVVVVNRHGAVCFVNSAAESLLGREARQLLGEVFGIPVAPGQTEVNLLRNGLPVRIAEMRVVETEWQGKPAYLATLRDITERKRAEARVREAIRRRDEFLAMLSHELRNPLAAISNAASVMAAPALDTATFARAREIVERQCRQMTRLLEDLLDVSRISRGKIELQVECLSLETLVAEAVDAVSPLMNERGHCLKVTLPREPLHIDADAVRAQQVLVNLLTNAARYSDPRRRVWLDVSGAAGQAVIRVRDDGVGMSSDVLASIFEPFVQVENTLARANGGLGIGLALVRSLVELHGGTVEARSDGPGRGSEFIVRLPLSRDVPAVLRADAVSRCSRSLRVLIVEDNADVRQMLQAILELEGHEVASAEEGRSGLSLIEFQRPDVALVDIGLPGMDGYEIAQRARSNAALDKTYLVALTGYGQLKDRRRALQSGFDAHVAKPVDLDALSRILADRAEEKCVASRSDAR